MRWMWIAIIGASLALASCGKSDDKDKGKTSDKGNKADKGDKASSGPVGACDRREKEFLCGEYYGKMATKDWVKEQCDYQKVPTLDKCPTEGAIGRCVMFAGTAQELHEVWFKGGEAMFDMCENKDGEKRDP